MIDREHDLPVTKQAKILRISRGSVYYRARPVSATDLEVMRRLDRLHLEFPFAGSRMLQGLLSADRCKIGRRHVKTLMRRMGIEALYRRPRTTKPEPGRRIYPYLLRGIEITRPNQVWAMDITYIPMARVSVSAIADDMIRTYAATTPGSDVIVHGFFVDGVLRGAADLRRCRRTTVMLSVVWIVNGPCLVRARR